MKWIACKEKLPKEDGEYVLAWPSGGSCEVHEFYFHMGHFYFYKDGIYGLSEGRLIHQYVTHWMPLPKPPKLENED
jgi:hypothetical protein